MLIQAKRWRQENDSFDIFLPAFFCLSTLCLRWHLARHRPRVFTQGGLTPEIRTPEIPNPTRLV